MKSKRHHQASSDDSDVSEASVKSSSSSASESDDSSISEHRHKKKRKRADSSESESESDDQRRSKKRKHKKKKKKHGKKKRRSNSPDSISAEDISSASDVELSSKKKRKHKHKHSKRGRSASASGDEVHVERRLHSVVKERRASSEEGSQPSRTYYQREYRHSASGEEYDREREVQRFYRGSSKERNLQYQEQRQYERERNDKYASQQDKNYRPKYGQNTQYTNTNEDYGRRQREYDEYKRNQRFELNSRPQEEYNRRPREEAYQPRQDPRGFNQNNRYNQYEKRGPERQLNDNKDYRERRGPQEPDRYRDREFQEKKERYQERYASERPREVRPRERPSRPDKPAIPYIREPSKSRSPQDRSRERYRRPENRDVREDRYKEGRGDEQRERPARSADRKEAERPPAKPEQRPRERRSSVDRKEAERPSAKPEQRPRERSSRFESEDKKEYNWGKTDPKKEGAKEGDKEKPNFGLSGKLTADANTVNGVVIKYAEPDDAKQPKRRWRFYPFKGDKALPILYIHRQSAYLIGRDKKVADIFLEHPSISKQHAALQFRATPFNRPDGSQGRRVRPYIIDLESANGTFVNNKKVDQRCYVELLERDVVKFGFSQREFVLLHENSKDDAQDDDNQEPVLGANVTTTDQIKMEKRVKQEVVEDGD